MSSNSDYLEIVYGELSDPKEDRRRKWSLRNSLAECYDTLVAHSISLMFWTLPSLFLFSCTMPVFWPLVILYLSWLYYDRQAPHRRGRKYSDLRKLPMWRRTRNYFPVKMVKTAELPPVKNYLFASFPHGVSCYGMATNIITEANRFSEAYPGLNPYVVTLKEIFYFPITRDIWLALGLRASSAEGMTDILNGPPGTVCVVVVGGAKETQMSIPGTNKLFLKNRKGFVRLALKTGASLVPVYSFGETDTYYQPSNEVYQTIQAKIQAVTKAPVIAFFKGRGFFQSYFGILPYRTPITTVIGKPIDLPKIENPTEDDVNEYHRKFISELELLFNKFKGKYDRKGENAVLEIY